MAMICENFGLAFCKNWPREYFPLYITDREIPSVKGWFKEIWYSHPNLHANDQRSFYDQGFICIEPSRVCSPPPLLKFTKKLIKTWTNYVEVLLRCLYGNININLCFSFPRFAQWGHIPLPHPPPWAAKVADDFNFSHVSPTKLLGQIKPCSWP